MKTTAYTSRSVAVYGYKKAATAVAKVATPIGKAFLNAGKKTQAAIVLASSYFVHRSYRYGIGNTISSILNIIGDFIGFGGRMIDKGIRSAENIVEVFADTARYVADNTSTVFLMIISAIGIIITLKYFRK